MTYHRKLKKKFNLKYFFILTTTFLVLILIGLQLSRSRPRLDISSLDISNSESKVAVIKSSGNTTASRGDLWLINSNGNNEKRITTNANLEQIFGWSPDNRYVAASLYEDHAGPNGTNWYLCVVEISTGNIIKLNNKKNGEFQVYWLSNTDLVDLKDQEIVIRKVSNSEESPFLPIAVQTKIENLDLSLSPDKNWISIGKSPFQTNSPVIQTYSIQADRLFTIVPPDVNHRYVNWGAAWSGNSLLTFLNTEKESQIWISDANGNNRNLILSLPLNRDDYSDLGLVEHNPQSHIFLNLISHNKTKNSKLLEYVLDTKEVKEINLENAVKNSGSLNNLDGGFLGKVSVSKPNDYLVFDRDGYVYKANIQTGTVNVICKDFCFSPSLSN